jgi:hypothetical protein
MAQPLQGKKIVAVERALHARDTAHGIHAPVRSGVSKTLRRLRATIEVALQAWRYRWRIVQMDDRWNSRLHRRNKAAAVSQLTANDR